MCAWFYLDTVRVEFPDGDALEAVERLRGEYVRLTGGHKSQRPHAIKHASTAVLAPWDAPKPGDPFAWRFSAAWLRDDLCEFSQQVAGLGAKLTGLDVSVDFPVGTFLLSSHLWLTCRPGDRWRRPTQRDEHGRIYQTAYVGHVGDSISAASYSDRPSKLDPDGPPVQSTEVRFTGDRVPSEVVADLGLLASLDLPEIIAEHVSVGPSFHRTFSAVERVLDVLRLGADERGFITLSLDDIAQLGSVPKSTVQGAIRALRGEGVLRVRRRGGGRFRRTSYRVRMPARAYGCSTGTHEITDEEYCAYGKKTKYPGLYFGSPWGISETARRSRSCSDIR